MGALRQFLAGLSAGIVLTAGATTLAATGALTGLTVQGTMPVVYKGTALPEPAVIVDGHSYLKMVSVGQALGIPVTYDSANNQVILGNPPQQGPNLAQYFRYKVVNNIGVPMGDSPTSAIWLAQDGTIYVESGLFGNYWNGTGTGAATVDLPNKPVVTFDYTGAYVPGVQAFSQGLIYISLPALGITGSISGDTLTLNWK